MTDHRLSDQGMRTDRRLLLRAGDMLAGAAAMPGGIPAADAATAPSFVTDKRRSHTLPWDAQFYPDGINGWMVKLDTDAEGGMAFDPDSFCFP